MSIKLSPPDIGQNEIDEVVDTLKSGWITTGPKTALLEDQIVEYTGAKGCLGVSSATAGMEIVLRYLGIGPGDEVITTPYTYTASAAVIHHVGAKIVFADVKKGSYHIDPSEIAKKITDRTRAIIPVDYGGELCDYKEIYRVIDRSNLKKRPVVLSDSAHGLGSERDGIKAGAIADFTVFSLHAVKNVTTAEGGLITWTNNIEGIYKELRCLTLHGQSKDALAKTRLGSWEYDILTPGYKCNMTDISASLGLAQLKRYREDLLNRRRAVFKLYCRALRDLPVEVAPFSEGNSAHLMSIRIEGFSEDMRNRVITLLAHRGIPANVHYKPLPLFTAYKNLGFNIKDYPNSYNMYCNQLTLPLHTLLEDRDVEFICKNLSEIISTIQKQ